MRSPDGDPGRRAGTRLEPLTRDRAKPAVPFGGLYRIIDFTLSNCINSGLRRILVLTQYKARSLDRHIRAGWSFLSRELGEYVEVAAAAAAHRRALVQGHRRRHLPEHLHASRRPTRSTSLILAGDHIYKMDYGDMIRAHIEREADLTIGCIPVPLARGDALRRHAGRRRRPRRRLPGEAERRRRRCPATRQHCLASMGIYVFTARLMYELLCQDATRPDSDHDFGKNIIPAMIETHQRVRLPLPRQEPQGRRRTGATSARSTPTTRPTWT